MLKEVMSVSSGMGIHKSPGSSIMRPCFIFIKSKLDFHVTVDSVSPVGALVYGKPFKRTVVNL